MASSVRFAVITPSEVKFEGKAELVVAPGAAGDLGALPNHAPMLTTLRIGVVRATVVDSSADDANNVTRRLELAVNGGFMEILPDRVVVLTDLALTASDIDEDAVRAQLRRAEEELAAKHGADDAQQRRAVAWANARLEVAHRPNV
jgi:F-type H+-transporting ATPase subunit epsilon